MSPYGPFARREAEAPAPDQIPGLRGAPMRTPVKASGAATGPELWPSLAARVLARQLWIELYGLPGYSLTLKGGRAQGFAATPRDFRPLDAGAGRGLLAGRFTLAGASLEIGSGGDPWNRPTPSRAFAVELHAFTWLPALMEEGERGAREAMRLTLGWDQAFARWSPFAWGDETMPRRVYRLACAARRMGAAGTDEERTRLADSLHRQARQLLRPPRSTARQAERLAAAALAGCALAGPTGARLRRLALGRLPAALARTVGEDGGHASRSPEAGLELLLDLLTLDDALAQLSETTPEAVPASIERLLGALRVLTLPDGRLVSLQGGGPSQAARIAAASAGYEAAPSPDPSPPPAEVGGVVRISSPLLTVVADAAPPARGPWSAAACAQPLALEIVCGRDRLITGCGWTPRASDRQALRLTPAHSTLTLGDGSLGEPLGGWKAELMGPRLISRTYSATHELREGEGAVWLELEHDGWVHTVGLKHQRRLYLDQRLDELRAEERLYPGSGQAGVARPIAAPYAVRFHLEPGVQASLARDRRSILLRGQSGRGWWFRTDGPDVAVEPSVHVEDGLTRRSLQIVVRGSARTDAESKVRWKLSPAGAPGDPVA